MKVQNNNADLGVTIGQKKINYLCVADILFRLIWLNSTEGSRWHWMIFIGRTTIAPTENLPVITNKKQDRLSYFHWGLVPFWAKDLKVGFKMINARAESLMEKGTFKNALEKRRCLVIADGFYEWKKTAKGKQPYRLIIKNGSLFAFAGLWEYNKDLDINSFSIITSTANELVEPIYDRMPVILRQEHEKKWLNENLDPVEALDLLQPFPADLMEAYPVNQDVGNVRNKYPELILPLGT